MLTNHHLKIKSEAFRPLAIVRIQHNQTLLEKYDRLSYQALLRLHR
ncbi:hypothetical protein NIES2104_26350 [Leptolyngbya sp. NIES-2104]|nr:hypothetical protein NIES2104_26350 [Leptolyngbya sp. NIES-2104]